MRLKFTCLAAASVVLASCQDTGTTAPQTSTEADLSALSELELRAVHDQILTIDTHVDVDDSYASADLDPGSFTSAQVDLPKMRAGGLDAAFFIVYTGQGALTDEAYAAARASAEQNYRDIARMIAAYPDQIVLARTADEVEAIAATGRRVALIGIENAYPLGATLDDLPLWTERGVRYASITHFGNNQFGGSSNPNTVAGDPEEDPGLTELGRALVAGLNDHGIMVDISHVGKRTMLEAVALSRAPVLASHSGAYGVYANARNLDDEQLEAIRGNGGVAQMVAFRGYVKARPEPYDAEVQALREALGLATPQDRQNATPDAFARYREALTEINGRYPDVMLSDFVDHIDHAVTVAGIDHVGIASDFDGGGGVGGWDDASETFAVTQELVRRGYSREDLDKLWGANLLRVMRDVEAAAAH